MEQWRQLGGFDDDVNLWPHNQTVPNELWAEHAARQAAGRREQQGSDGKGSNGGWPCTYLAFAEKVLGGLELWRTCSIVFGLVHLEHLHQTQRKPIVRRARLGSNMHVSRRTCLPPLVPIYHEYAFALPCRCNMAESARAVLRMTPGPAKPMRAELIATLMSAWKAYEADTPPYLQNSSLASIPRKRHG